MNYDALRANDTVRVHGYTAEETAKRLQEMEQVARRHLTDAEAVGLSPDARHNLAYAAGRGAAENRWSAKADDFDKRRQRRNASGYEQAGTISPTEAETIVHAVQRLLDEVLAWLRESRRLPAGEAGG